MVAGDGSCNKGGTGLGACCASCLVMCHGKPVVLRQGPFSQEPLEQAWSLSGVFGVGPAMEPDRTLSRFGEVRVGVWAGLGEVV
jgi:hypothetical protein